MKRFDTKTKNFFYFLYRMASPIVDPVKFGLGIIRYPKYFFDLYKFTNNNSSKISVQDLFPILDENTPFTKFDYHYFYQQLWVFDEVLANKPDKHVDVGSTYEMSGYISSIVPTDFVDIRPIVANKKNLNVVKGSINNLPYETGSLASVSCLHVLEHIGLGRYGDEVDANSYKEAVKELMRVLKPGGFLYLSTPVGNERICFNAHRVFNPNKIIEMFSDLKLEKFSSVTDSGELVENAQISEIDHSDYALGMFKFKK